jgi:hypothetical protein
MSKSNTKTKLTLVRSNQKKKNSSSVVGQQKVTSKPSEPQTLEQLATVDFWKKEIASLKTEQFDSVAQATEKLIDQVLERLELKRNGEEDVKEFLRLVFESSETLQSALRKTLSLET